MLLLSFPLWAESEVRYLLIDAESEPTSLGVMQKCKSVKKTKKSLKTSVYFQWGDFKNMKFGGFVQSFILLLELIFIYIVYSHSGNEKSK